MGWFSRNKQDQDKFVELPVKKKQDDMPSAGQPQASRAQKDMQKPSVDRKSDERQRFTCERCSFKFFMTPARYKQIDCPWCGFIQKGR